MINQVILSEFLLSLNFHLFRVHRGALRYISIFVYMFIDLKNIFNVLAICYGLRHESEQFPNPANSLGVVGSMSSKTTTELESGLNQHQGGFET